MTQNQIEYWKLEELKRANLINEAQARAIAAETKRHNQAVEANESRRIDTLVQSNYLTSLANTETARANRQREQQTAADQLLRQYLGQLQAASSQYTADINRQNALTSAAATQYAANVGAAASRYSADAHVTATKYSSNNSLQGTKYSANVQASTADKNRNQDLIKFSQSSAQAAAQLDEAIRHNKAVEKQQQWNSGLGLFRAIIKGASMAPNKGGTFLMPR